MSKSMYDLFAEQLGEAFGAETQLTAALPRMAAAAKSPDLKAGFEKHLGETHAQIHRLDRAATELNLRLVADSSDGMRGLIAAADEVIAAGYEPEVLDAALIAAAQRIEHFEIATYGCLLTWAKKLGYPDIAKLLRESLDEEKKADVELTKVAEAEVNHHAVMGDRHE